jgi:glycosyltransferase involved in cell wall biosynthesis
MSVYESTGDSRTPRVSVVMPLFNTERFVLQALESVVEQGIDNMEVIVVDDGSTDQGVAVVEKFAANAKVPVYLLMQAHSGGAAKPRNVGIEHARGEFVAFIDPDDYWYATKLRQQLEVLTRHETVAMVFADPEVVDEIGNVLGRYLGRVRYAERAAPHLRKVAECVYLSRPSFYAFSSAEVAGPITSNVMLRRSALLAESEWFPVQLRVGEDMDLWFRIMQKHMVAFVDRPLSAYRQHGASLMNQVELMLTGSLDCHERNFVRAESSLSFDQCRRYRERIASFHSSIGYQAWLSGDGAMSRSAYLRAWRWNRSSLHLLGWLKSCAPKQITEIARLWFGWHKD